MSTYIKNASDWIKAGKKIMYEWILTQQKNIPQYLEDYIMSEYYDQYSPSDLYDRQYRILSAITASDIIDIGDGYRLEIYLDPNKVSYDPSIWTYPDGAMLYMQGDDPLTVFQNMSMGIHGFIGNPRPYQTQGRFWEEFLSAIGESGTYDMFKGFTKYMNNKGYLIIK